ncbi:MAG: hypothetical protein HKP56_09090 [Anderseniella sp.]|nr:hypothetical protein [Anderseniella sp.]
MAKSIEQLTSDRSTYFDWSPVWAGTAVAVATSLVLSQFGAAAGLGVGKTMVNDTTASWGVLVAGLWLAVTALSASTAGGYLAGRMRMPLAAADPNEREFRDGVHGLTVWAVSTVIALLAASMLALSASAGATAASAAVTDIPENVARYARNGSVIIAFATAAAAALGAAAAWFSAEMGGKHRDDNINIGELVPAFMRKR